MDVNPQGSHIHFRDPQTPWINDPNSVSMEGKAHDLNLLKGRCDRAWKSLCEGQCFLLQKLRFLGRLWTDLAKFWGTYDLRSS